MKKHMIRILSAADTKKALTMPEAIDAMATAFEQLSSGEANVPMRTRMNIEKESGDALFMPVYLPGTHKFALKTVSVYPENILHMMPVIQALVTIFDARNGRPLAVLDGEALTAIRTGAASGLATRLLARKNARIAAIIGAGAQGKTQLEAILHVRPLERIYIIDRDLAQAESFIREMTPSCSAELVPTTDAGLIREADIICCATSSRKPVFNDEHIKTGAHINGIGSFKPDMQEIPAETIIRSTLVVDSRSACLVEAGDIIIPLRENRIDESHIYAEIGELVSGIKPGRTKEEELTIFKSVGNAVQDLAAADIVLKKAEQLDLGLTVEL